jgi:hypothetical protein
MTRMTRRRCLGMMIFAGSICFVATSREAFGHGIPTHQRITAAAVRLLQEQMPKHRLACDAQLNSDLQEGTVKEDDSPRFLFHFTPKLPISSCPSAATEGTQSWGFARPGQSCQSVLAPFGMQNVHAWRTAVDRARDDRQGWKELGYVLHLLCHRTLKCGH